MRGAKYIVCACFWVPNFLAELFHPLNVGRVNEGRPIFYAFPIEAGVVVLEVVLAGGRKGEFEFGFTPVVNQ